MSTPPRTGPAYGAYETYGRHAAAPPNPPQAPDGRAAGGGLRHRLGWAFTGAVLASVVWGGVVLSVPGLVTTTTSPQSVHGYRPVDDLCRTAGLVRFTQLYPNPDDSPSHHTERHPALDSMSCVLSLQRNSSTSSSGDDYASLYLRVELHKAVNASSEFDAERAGMQQQHYQTSDVPGLGEEAYLAFRDEVGAADRSWHSVSHELQVRDGGMTYYLSWSGSYQDGKSTPPDRETIRQALLADSRDLLKALGGP